jgi:hypothetical protein
VALLIGFLASPYMGLASLAYFLMVGGMGMRKRDRWLHRRLMYSAMGIDLSLVLFLEWQRNAMETVAALSLTPLQFGHVLSSTSALLLYLPLILLGKKLWEQERSSLRKWHRGVGIAGFFLRSLGFLLMFSLLGRGSPI